MRLHAVFRSVLLRLQTSLWLWPSIAVGLATVVGATLTTSAPVGDSFRGWLFAGDLEASRGLLQTVAGSTITVTGLVFTLTIVALQVASGQYSPRLVGTFLSDRGNQLVLSSFLASFSYSMVVLRSLPPSDSGEVPRLAVTVGMVLSMGSLLALVYFVHHLTQSIRVETILEKATAGALTTMEKVYPELLEAGGDSQHLPDVPDHAVRIPVWRSGYVEAVDSEALHAVAMDHSAVIRIRPLVGEYVAKDSVIAWAWSTDDAGPAPDPSDVASDMVGIVGLGPERTVPTDVAFGLRQIVDVAARALSPGINDPTTAVDALAHLTGPLTQLARRRIEPKVTTDDDGAIRVGVPRRDFGDLLELCCGQPRRYGATEPDLLRALLRMLAEVLAVTDAPDRRDVVQDQIDLVLATGDSSIAAPHDNERVHRLAKELQAELHDDPQARSQRAD